MSEAAAFYRAIAATPADNLPRLVAADWFEERGQQHEAAALRYGQPWSYNRFPSGDGHGYGDGDGDGHGHGDGHGYGDGCGCGYGYGYGYGKLPERWQPMCEVGKRQIIVLPHAWVICGDVKEQTGPFSFRVENASVICRTGGTPWDQLADGQGRAGATFRPWGTVTISNPFLCREWKGKLPT
jgi:uncharacterized protein (TIGR02996 family)